MDSVVLRKADSAVLLLVRAASAVLRKLDSVVLLLARVASAVLRRVVLVASADLRPAVDSVGRIKDTALRPAAAVMVHRRWAVPPATVNRLPAADSAEHLEVPRAISSPVVRLLGQWEWAGLPAR